MIFKIAFNIQETINYGLIFLIGISFFAIITKLLLSNFNKVVYIEKNYSKYRKLEKNPLYKIFLKKKDLKLGELSVNINEKDYVSVNNTLDSMKNIKLNPNEKQMLNIIRLRNYLNQKDLEKAQKLVHSTNEKYKASDDKLVQSFIREMELMLNVDYLKEKRYIAELKKDFDSSDLPFSKALNGLRIYHVLKYHENHEEANYYYEQVRNISDENAIQEILNNIQYN